MSEELINRIPPQATDAEIAVLGALMLEPDSAYKVIEVLKTEDFYIEAHRNIYSAILELVRKTEPVDQLTVTQKLTQMKLIDKVGGAIAISGLLAKVPTAANVEYYVQIVREKAILRSIISTSTELITDAYREDVDVDEILDHAQQKMFEMKEKVTRSNFIKIGDVIADPVMKEIERLAHHKGDITGVPTDFTALDKLTAGFQPSDLIILAGRPSMGKTAVALTMAKSMAVKHKKTVGFFSLEMSHDQIVKRLLASQSNVDQQLIRTGKIPQDLWSSIINAASILTEAPIYVDDTPSLNIMDIRSRARRLKAEHGLDIIFVDYLQLAHGPFSKEGRQYEISMISQGLKALAKELGTPVVALSQLSRAVEQRGGDHRPQLSDLRESGAIEQDADVVIFVYREFVYSKDPQDDGKAELIIAKQRNGPTGDVKLNFISRTAKFENPAFDYDEDRAF